MPRTPEVCPPLFCPLSYFSNIACRVLGILPHALRHQASACGHLRSDFYRLPFAVLLLRCAFCLLVITCNSSLDAALAQGTTATLSGTVTDQNGAVIPDVSIAVINIAQGFQRSTTTNGEGAFVVPLLPPGHYTVKAEHNGFTPTEVRDVVLNVNDQVAMKIHMNVGTVSQTVQIVEGSSLINESPAVGTVVDRHFVENMPLNGRSFQSLIALTPGVVVTKSTFAEQGQFSVNGQRADANYFTIDGVGANVGISAGSLNQSGGGALPGVSAVGGTSSLVSIDALQEFRIQTSTYAPEFGRTPGAQVQIATRSGTNQFHGALFEYFRNDALDASDWFANANRLPKPPLRQNDFGGVFSGPILLPRFGEGGRQPWYNGSDSTFFFFSYEGLRLRLPQTFITNVPSMASRQAAQAQIRPFLNAYPVPNGTVFSNGFAEFNASYSDPSTLDATSVRIDHSINDKLVVFGRYNYAPSKTTQRGISNNSLNVLNDTGFKIQTLTFGVTQNISPRVSNEIRANYSNSKGGVFVRLDEFGGAIVPADTVLFPPFASPMESSFRLDLTGGRSLFVGKSADNSQRQINLVDNLSLVARSHQLKFGVDYRWLSPIFSGSTYNQSVAFPSVTRLAAGSASSAAVGANGIVPLLINNFSAYGQDTWKATRRLTLTYGLRWEVNSPPKGIHGNDLFTFQNLDNPAALVLAPQGTPLYETSYNNFAPRVGLAFQLSQRPGREIIIRGGFGIFYDLGTGSLSSATSFFPYTRRQNTPAVAGQVPFPLTPNQTSPPPFKLSPPFGTIIVADRGLKLPRTYQWNVALEQSLGPSQTVSSSYVAAVGRRLLRRENIVTPTNDSINITRNAATSDYHALQLQFQRRLSHGLQALVSYTWSHSIDIASSDSGTNAAVAFVNPSLDRGSSDFDVRHSFSGAFTYDLPTGKKGTVGSALFGNWAIDGIATIRSATPVDLVGAFNLTGFFSNLRPNFIQGIPLYLNDPIAPGARRFNNTVPTAVQIAAAGCAPLSPATPAKGPFCTPPTGLQGTLGRNVLRGFPVSQFDVALRRQFSLAEAVKFQFRAEFFNVFNHPNFADPLSTLSNPNFGRSTAMLGRSLGTGGVAGGFNPLYQIGGPRSVQFALRLMF